MNHTFGFRKEYELQDMALITLEIITGDHQERQDFSPRNQVEQCYLKLMKEIVVRLDDCDECARHVLSLSMNGVFLVL